MVRKIPKIPRLRATTNKFMRGFCNKKLFCPDEILFHSRWLLYIISLGLLVALAIYLLNFLWQIGHLLADAPKLITASGDDQHELMLIMVNLLDRSMVASLIVLTIMGGHQIYIRRFRNRRRSDIPQWLDHVDTIILKVKLGLALTGISSVVLLEDLVKPDSVTPDAWHRHLTLHATFLLTTLVAAIVWRLMHPKDMREAEAAHKREAKQQRSLKAKAKKAKTASKSIAPTDDAERSEGLAKSISAPAESPSSDLPQ